MPKPMTVALVGNPNAGKTALFNALTGSHQRVGNWPGVTVECKTGTLTRGQHVLSVVDLPGTYSLSVMSDTAVDEKIACQYLLSSDADVLINVIDGTNLVRHLYLTLQLLEMNIPVVLAVNMMDIVDKRGIQLDLPALSRALGVPVVPVVASRAQGVEALVASVLQAAAKKTRSTFQLPLRPGLKERVMCLATALLSAPLPQPMNATGLALRLLENDCFVAEHVGPDTLALARQYRESIETLTAEESDILIADARYTAANALADQVTRLKTTTSQTVTQWVDRVVLNRYAGIPIFFLIMYVMFVFAINVGGAFQDFFDISSDAIFIQGVAHVLAAWHAPGWLVAFLAHGVGQGINTVITFAPVIGAMFLFLAFLEDCGYMARAAFVMDRLMQVVGLPGKAFVPMIVLRLDATCRYRRLHHHHRRFLPFQV
jgi:ferrous iron transport protein B